MSLVICSNKNENGLEYDRDFKGQAPFSFTNHMVQTVELPPNSEVAVQSVKLNKDGLIRVSPNDRWYMLLNQNMRTIGTIPNVLNSTGMPVISSPNIQTDDYVNIDEFRRLIEEGLQLGIPHPDYFKANGQLTKCQILRGTSVSPTTTGTGFQGFRLSIVEQAKPVGNAFSSSNANYSWLGKNAVVPTANPYTISLLAGDTGVRFAPNVTLGAGGVPNEHTLWGLTEPLTNKQGIMEFDLTGLQSTVGENEKSFNNNWTIGLMRGTPQANGSLPYKTNAGNNFSNLSSVIWDYAVSCEQLTPGGNRWLRVGHLIKDPNDNYPGHPCSMREVIYFKGNNGVPDTFPDSHFTAVSAQGQGRYNMSSNAEEFSKLKFEYNNEIITISLYSETTSAYVVLSSQNQRTGGSIGQDAQQIKNTVKPRNQNCWCLTPKILIADSTKHVDLTTYQGINLGTGLTVESPEVNWYARMYLNGGLDNCIDLDTRWFMNEASTSKIYPCVDSIDDYLQYDRIMILVPDTTHYQGTEGANIQYKLGFTARAILDSSAESGVAVEGTSVYDSDNTPLLKANSSLFIRLDNMTQKTFNAGTGRISKILYHMPRFDQSNREIGTGLYYEPGERVYVKLNNSESIYLNELALSICDDKEILVDDLTGETIIILHFKQSSTPLFRAGRQIMG